MANRNGYIQVIEFQQSFPTMNLDRMENNPKDYDMQMIVVYTLETENGYKVKKVGKTYKKGTKVTYEPFKSQEDVKEYKDILTTMLDKFNSKYNTNHFWQ
ncbi:hypothetical protein [Clostridium sp.]|uniref:hypothetical protein n=1 Tax=Clostridium sp. TaxID=1506 RepID=UPI003216A6E9